MYIFNKSIINRIPNKPTSIERVIFPAMAAEKELYRMVLPGFWMDIGQPPDFLTGQCLMLQSMNERGLGLSHGANIEGIFIFSCKNSDRYASLML